jgi:multiple sugar transport system substrate-binding protein
MRTPFNSPTLKTLYDDPEVLESMPVIALGKEALQNARPRPVSPHYSEMSSKMAEQFNGVLRGATSPEEAVQMLQSELQQIIEQGQ